MGFLLDTVRPDGFDDRTGQMQAPASASSVSWTAIFSESVTGVGEADFSLTRTGGLTGGAITGVAGSGTTYTVTASTGSGDGTLRVDLADDDSIKQYVLVVEEGLQGTTNC